MENWGRNVKYLAREVVRVREVEEVARVVRENKRVRVLGTRHSFNRVADTDGVLVDVSGMRRCWDGGAGVRVEPGVTYGQLGEELEGRARGIENYPSLPHVCVGGAVQTGTHGSGTKNLSTQVSEVAVVTASGEVRRVKAGDVEFNGSVVSLGLLGVVVELNLITQPYRHIVQEVYTDVSLEELREGYGELIGGANPLERPYSVSLFTKWMNGVVDQVWVKRRVDRGWREPAMLRGKKSAKKLHPIREVDPEFCTEQGVAGPAHERLPHFKMEFEPSSAGAELQSEYFVSRQDVGAVMAVMGEIGPQLQECLMVSEVRSVDRDELWMSPCYGRDSVGIHFTWRPREAEVFSLLKEVVEPALRPFAPRPHWGKVFVMEPAEVMSRYERLGDFRALCQRWDPEGKFRNSFTRRYIFGQEN